MKENTNLGSRVWRKLLKLRDIPKLFFKMEVGNGKKTSFWYDVWSKVGRLQEVLGDRGCIALGISANAMVADVLGNHGRRRHRVSILNEVEDEIEALRLVVSQEEDTPLWTQR